MTPPVLLYGVIMLLMAGACLAIPQIPTVYQGSVSLHDGTDPTGSIMRMSPGSFIQEAAITEDDTYTLSFQTDDPETSAREGVRSGDMVTVFINGKEIATFTVEDYGVSRKDFFGVDLSEEPSGSGGAGSEGNIGTATLPPKEAPQDAPMQDTPQVPSAADAQDVGAASSAQGSSSDDSSVSGAGVGSGAESTGQGRVGAKGGTLVWGIVVLITVIIIIGFLLYVRGQK